MPDVATLPTPNWLTHSTAALTAPIEDASWTRWINRPLAVWSTWFTRARRTARARSRSSTDADDPGPITSI